MEAVYCYEMSVPTYETAWRKTSEDQKVNPYFAKNFRSHRRIDDVERKR
jgi:hypothetical protein